LSTYWETCHQVWEVSLPKLLNYKYEATYVSDRLQSILRMPQESRPLITVYGSMISEHAIMCSGIRFGNEERTLPLFPIPLIETITQLISKSSSMYEGRIPVEEIQS
jgi:hypothetical protein